jgi:hypothetical protein
MERNVIHRHATRAASVGGIAIGNCVAEEFQQIVDDYVRATYGGEMCAARLMPERKTVAIKSVA